MLDTEGKKNLHPCVLIQKKTGRYQQLSVRRVYVTITTIYLLSFIRKQHCNYFAEITEMIGSI